MTQHKHHFRHVVYNEAGIMIMSQRSPYGPLIRESDAEHKHMKVNQYGLHVGGRSMTWEEWWVSPEHTETLHNPPEPLSVKETP